MSDFIFQKLYYCNPEVPICNTDAFLVKLGSGMIPPAPPDVSTLVDSSLGGVMGRRCSDVEADLKATPRGSKSSNWRQAE